VPIAESAVTVQMGAGKASMAVDDLELRDFFTIPNALFHFLNPESEAATCSFDIQWSGPVTDRRKLNDPDVGFAGVFILCQATMTWSAQNAGGFSFVSNPAGTTSFFAQLGHIRNGVFFES
jgi:hypothetical protein